MCCLFIDDAGMLSSLHTVCFIYVRYMYAICCLIYTIYIVLLTYDMLSHTDTILFFYSSEICPKT
jgi:hypothetical protein